MPRVPVSRTPLRLLPDPCRVIMKPFAPGGDLSLEGDTRLKRMLARILALSEAEVVATLAKTEQRFAGRHVDLRSMLESNFEIVADHLMGVDGLSVERRLLIGAYFSHEYSIESAALTNPSIVLAPDQAGVASGEARFVLSLRAIGEGHISSIEFRSGVIDANGVIEMDVPTRYAGTAPKRAPIYDKKIFRIKLLEHRADNEVAADVLGALEDRFTLEQLETAIRETNQRHGSRPDAEHATRTIHWLASSNYESSFPANSNLSERVLFPSGPTESQGMEDARFVRFTREDGTVTYYAQYTAFDGYQILPQLIETADFLSFRIATLGGAMARNKGIALFPRKIGGRYAALARLDNENNFLMWAEDVRQWHTSEIIQRPDKAWEFRQLGNCGSPLETEAGWLVLTHGVGPMREYSIGAILLDKEDPTRVIGHLDEPLLQAEDDERDGYVPNVLYSCGSMISGERLVLPYGFSDVGTRIATVRLEDLLSALT